MPKRGGCKYPHKYSRVLPFYWQIANISVKDCKGSKIIMYLNTFQLRDPWQTMNIYHCERLPIALSSNIFIFELWNKSLYPVHGFCI